MFEGFPKDDLGTLLKIFDKFKGAYYQKDFEDIYRDIQTGPATDCGQDFAHWSYLFDGSVFAGRGANPGLSEFCNAIVDHLGPVVRAGGHTKIANWYYRIRFLQALHAKNHVPPLKPLQQIACALNEASLGGASQVADRFDGDVQGLKHSWDNGAKQMADKISSSFLDGDTILSIGHSKVLNMAISQAQASGTTVNLYLYCPGPDFAVGRFPNQCECAVCPFASLGGKSVLRDDAVNLIRDNTISKILCATCAYTSDRKLFWITVGGDAIGDAAKAYGKPFIPVGGAYKQLRDDLDLGFIDDLASNLVDMLRAVGSCDTRFLD